MELCIGRRRLEVKTGDVRTCYGNIECLVERRLSDDGLDAIRKDTTPYETETLLCIPGCHWLVAKSQLWLPPGLGLMIYSSRNEDSKIIGVAGLRPSWCLNLATGVQASLLSLLRS